MDQYVNMTFYNNYQNSIVDFVFPKEELNTEEDVMYVIPEEPIRKLHRILREKVTFKQSTVYMRVKLTLQNGSPRTNVINVA